MIFLPIEVVTDTPHHFLEEAFYRRNIALCSEHKLYCIALFVKFAI